MKMRVCTRNDFAGFEHIYDEIKETRKPLTWCPKDIGKLNV